MNLPNTIEIAVAAIVFFLIPRLLEMLGVFKWLGERKPLAFLAGLLGSRDPSDFYNNVFRVAFVGVVGYFFFSGLAVTAFQCQEVSHYVTEVRSCIANGTAPLVVCQDERRNFFLGLPNGLPGATPTQNAFNETTTTNGTVSQTPNTGYT